MNDYNIKELYEEMELSLISSMKRNLARHLKDEEETGFEFTQWQAEKLKELKRYQRENKNIIGGYTKGLNKKIFEHLQRELKQGSIDAIKQYNKLHPENKKKPSKIMNKSFFQTNDRKVNNLVKVVNNDLKKANTAALRMVNDQYRQVIHKSAFFVGNGVMTEKQAVDMANKTFLSAGINCIEYKNGRRVNIASYSEMAVRTASLRAHLMGEGDFRKSIGRTLVQATSHGGACPICQKWEKHIFIDDVYSGGTRKDGKYMLLSEAMEQGFLHPNCRHGLTTYYPELEGVSYDEEEHVNDDLQDKINYYDRNEKKYNRLSIGSIDNDNQETYIDKKEYYRKKLNELLEKKKKLELKKANLEIKEDILESNNNVDKRVVQKEEFNPKDYSMITNSNVKKLSELQKISEKEEQIIYNRSTGYVASSNSFNINKTLREENADKLNYAQKETYNALSNVINKNKTESNIMAIRRVNLKYISDTFDFDLNKALNENNVLEQMKKYVNQTKIEKGFMSCSLNENKIIDGNVELNVFIPKGKNAFITKNYEESEIILNHNTKYKIHAVRETMNEYEECTLVLDIEIL